MEITCDQCGTVFSVDPDTLSLGTREVVCPGCFQFHPLPGPGPESKEKDSGLVGEVPVAPLGDGGIADRLRDGFTLAFDVRHPTWDEVRHLNPYEIQQCIYSGEFDGQEEYREKAGRWFPIGDNPSFALTFQLVGITLAKNDHEKLDPAHRKFVGWKGRPTVKQTPSAPPPKAEGVEVPPAAPPADRRKWALVASMLAALIAVAILLAKLL